MGLAELINHIQSRLGVVEFDYVFESEFPTVEFTLCDHRYSVVGTRRGKLLVLEMTSDLDYRFSPFAIDLQGRVNAPLQILR